MLNASINRSRVRRAVVPMDPQAFGASLNLTVRCRKTLCPRIASHPALCAAAMLILTAYQEDLGATCVLRNTLLFPAGVTTSGRATGVCSKKHPSSAIGTDDTWGEADACAMSSRC
jgi:hypothetical protein